MTQRQLNLDQPREPEPSNVVDLAAKAEEVSEYKAAVKDARERVEQVAQMILGVTFGVALTGEWLSWADAQPVGTAITLEPRKLQGCADPNVILLTNLYLGCCEVLAKLPGDAP
jgi:hypothetical protein